MVVRRPVVIGPCRASKFLSSWFGGRVGLGISCFYYESLVRLPSSLRNGPARYESMSTLSNKETALSEV